MLGRKSSNKQDGLSRSNRCQCNKGMELSMGVGGKATTLVMFLVGQFQLLSHNSNFLCGSSSTLLTLVVGLIPWVVFMMLKGFTTRHRPCKCTLG